MKFAVYGRAEAIDGEGEAVLGLQLLVERLGIGGVGVKRLFGLAALFAPAAGLPAKRMVLFRNLRWCRERQAGS